MKTLLFTFVMALSLVTFGCNNSSQPVDDSGITTKVKTKLAANKDTSAIKIGVETVNGVVTLDGTVPTAQEKSRAEEIAKATEGVTRVVNNIRVDSNSVGATNAGEKAEHAGDKAAGAAETAGDKVAGAAGAAGKELGDAAILTKIKTQYVADGIIGTNVDVTNGAVVLKGEVDNAAEKTKAEQIARKTDGVKSVKNQLTIKK